MTESDNFITGQEVTIPTRSVISRTTYHDCTVILSSCVTFENVRFLDCRILLTPETENVLFICADMTRVRFHLCNGTTMNKCHLVDSILAFSKNPKRVRLDNLVMNDQTKLLYDGNEVELDELLRLVNRPSPAP